MAYGYTGQANSAASASGTTLPVTFTVNPGDTAIIVYGAFTGALTTLGLADDKLGGSHTYNQEGSAGSVASTLTHRIAAYLVLAPTPGTYTLTMTLGAARANRRLVAITYNGAVAYQDAKNQGQLAAATTTDAVSTSNLAPTAQPALLSALSITANGTATYTQGTGHTSRGALSNWDAIGSFSSMLEDIRLTSTSAVAGLFTIGTSRDTLSQGMVLTESIPVSAAGGIASAEAFGTATVTRASQAAVSAAGGIASAGAFGTATVSRASLAAVSAAGGIVSAGAFGAPTLTRTGPAAAGVRPYQRLHLRIGL